MRVIIELSEKEIWCMEEAVNFKIEGEEDAAYALHVILANCI